MGTRKSSRRLISAFALLTLASTAAPMFAQQPPAGDLTLQRIADERDKLDILPRGASWSPDGKSLAYIRTIPPARPQHGGPGFVPSPPTSEIWSMDTSTGQQKLFIPASELIAAFAGQRARPLPGDEKGEESSRSALFQNYLWAPDGHALLLSSGISLAWFDLDHHTSKAFAGNEAGRADKTGKSPQTAGEKTIQDESQPENQTDQSEKKDIPDDSRLIDPQFSPDGHTVSYVRDHTLWLADVSTGIARAFARSSGNNIDDTLEGEPDWVYAHELNLHSAYWWSPNSASIAWLETDDRAVDKYPLRTSEGEEKLLAYPKPGGAIPTVHLFVRAITGGKATHGGLVKIDLGTDTNIYLPRVTWLPDGKHLAIERLSRDQKTLDLLLADASTGKTQTILTEKDVYWINLADDLRFLKDAHRFLWSSERSGYRHLYLYDIAGHPLAQLTHGDWEVTSLVGVDEANGTVYFTATEATPIERQLYRVNLDGSGFARVTQRKGTHQIRLSPSGNMFLDSFSSYVTPPRQELLHLDASLIATIGVDQADSSGNGQPAPAQFAPAQPAPIDFFTIQTHLANQMQVSLIKPSNFDPAQHYPVIFYIAGGPGEQAVRDAWGGDIALWFSFMARKGYVIFAVNNRGSAGLGHLSEEPIHLRFSAAEMADIRDGVLYLRTQPWVDKSRIGICGWGYGSSLVLHGMLDRPLLFKAGFAGSPISDWHLYDAVFAERYLEDPDRNQDGWLASSPNENAKYLSAPLLLAQATLDEKIHTENSLTLLDELLDQGKYADILLFPDRRSLFEDRPSRLILFQRLTEFFLKNV